VFEQREKRHQDARRAEPALKRMDIRESLLERM
jgi:hypothetical protein